MVIPQPRSDDLVGEARLDDRREGLVPIDDHFDALFRTVELAKVAGCAILGVGHHGPLVLLVPAEDVHEAGLVADLASVAAVEVDLDGVHVRPRIRFE